MQVASSNLGRLNEDKSQKKSTKENNQEKSENDSAPISSAEPDRLPPGTIQACEQPRRFTV
jgi:hypothetical protein